MNNIITECLKWLAGEVAGRPTLYIVAVSALANREKKLRAAAKAVLKASNGNDEAAMDEALEHLKRALK